MRARPAKRGVAVVCATIAASMALTPALAAPDSQPQKPGGGHHRPDNCVTMAEYDKAEPHMTRTAVHRLFDTVGVRTSIGHSGPHTDEVRTYDVCNSPDSTVTVSYRRGRTGPFRLLSKTAVWVA